MAEYKKMVLDKVEYLKNDGSTIIDHNSSLGYIGVEFPELDAEYFFDGSSYDELYEEYEKSCLSEILWFDEYVLYVSQDW